MRTLSGLEVNGKSADAVIESFFKPKRDESYKIIWVNEPEQIARMRMRAETVDIYAKDNADNIIHIIINAQSVKNLYQLITEIEQQESDEFID